MQEETKSVRIADVPPDQRPRERMRRLGAGVLSDAELLALFFGSGTVGLNVVDMSQALLEKYGTLTNLSRQPPKELEKQHGIGPAKALHLAALFELGRRAARQEFTHRCMENSQSVYDLLSLEMAPLEVESVRLVLLDAKFRLIRVEEVHRGAIDTVVASIRVLLRTVIRSEAFTFTLVHNHPSGDPTPSPADHSFTRKFREACSTTDMQFMDHIIIGQPSERHSCGYFSFRDHGLLR